MEHLQRHAPRVIGAGGRQEEGQAAQGGEQRGEGEEEGEGPAGASAGWCVCVGGCVGGGVEWLFGTVVRAWLLTVPGF